MKAKLSYIRIAPRKLRLVADTIRGKNLSEAKSILKFSKKKGAEPLAKLLASAEANAKNMSGGSSESLHISKLTVDEGPVYKRYMPRARGSSSIIKKKTSHIKLTLSEK